MAKKPKQPTNIPAPSDNDRFVDWSLDNLVPIEPGEVLVNDDPDDPNMFARHGESTPKPDKK
jgi:hypothetical protein